MEGDFRFGSESESVCECECGSDSGLLEGGGEEGVRLGSFSSSEKEAECGEDGGSVAVRLVAIFCFLFFLWLGVVTSKLSSR